MDKLIKSILIIFCLSSLLNAFGLENNNAELKKVNNTESEREKLKIKLGMGLNAEIKRKQADAINLLDSRIPQLDVEPRIIKKSVQDIVGGFPKQIEEIVTLLANPELKEAMGIRTPCFILLHGPSGTGKSSMVEAFARETKRKFYSFVSSEFINEYQSSGTRNIKYVFSKIKEKNEPAVLFVDEIDGVANNELRSSNGESQRLLYILHKEMDELHELVGPDSDKIIIFAATNKLGSLPDTIIRRFNPNIIEVGLPDQNKRISILKHYAQKNQRLQIDEKYFNDLAQQTDGFCCGDLKNLVNKAAMLTLTNQKTNTTEEEFNLAYILTTNRSLDFAKRKTLVRYHLNNKLPIDVSIDLVTESMANLSKFEIENVIKEADSLARLKNLKTITNEIYSRILALNDSSHRLNHDMRRLLVNTFLNDKVHKVTSEYVNIAAEELSGFTGNSIKCFINNAFEKSQERGGREISNVDFYIALIEFTMPCGTQITRTLSDEQESVTYQDVGLSHKPTNEMITIILKYYLRNKDVNDRENTISLFIRGLSSSQEITQFNLRRIARLAADYAAGRAVTIDDLSKASRHWHLNYINPNGGSCVIA